MASTRIIESGKYKGKTIDQCPVEYLQWASKHEKNFAERNQWISRDARFILERMAKEAEAQATRLEHIAAEDNFIAARELRMAKAAASQNKSNLSTQGNLYSNKGFSILR